MLTGLDIHDVREALILCGKPSRPALPFDKSILKSRLTDVSRSGNNCFLLVITDLVLFVLRYGGTHRLRFDSKGQGLGVAGRRDIRKIYVVIYQGYFSLITSALNK